MTATIDADLDVTDFFCGMGGSSSGLREAGFRVKLAANHWARAIETHSANHPDTEHLCADIQSVDLRFLPRTRVLWASPICTEVSPAGGKRKRQRAHDLFEDYGHVPDAAFERTRVTFWEVLRAAEIFRYDAILIENVTEVWDWELMPSFLDGLERLGYQWQVVSVSAAHIGDELNPYAPQWRDRIYIICFRKGVRMPRIEPRPWAFCPECGDVVQAIQRWNPIRGQRAKKWYRELHVGKYGVQYHYGCPIPTHGRVEPFVAPAASVIDWTDLGTRIGDRDKPLSPATMRRIQVGLDTIANPALIAASGNTWDSAAGAGNAYLRAWPPDEAPMPAQTTTVQHGIASHGVQVFAVNHDGDGRHFDPVTAPHPAITTKRGEALLMTEPFVTMLRENGRPRAVREPLATITTGRNHGVTIPPGAFIAKSYGGHATPDAERMIRSVEDPMPVVRASGHDFLAVPGAFISKHHGGLDYAPIGHMNKPADDPFPGVVAKPNLSLVIPYRKGSRAHRPDVPLTTITTKDGHGVLAAAERVRIEDCYFRMLNPREAAGAQRFPATYVITGNKGEQHKQAGNAVPVNVAHWLGREVAAVLNGGRP